MRIMPHSHTLSARVSMAWTITRPLGLRAGMGARAASSGTSCCCCCIPVKSFTVTWHHSKHSHLARPSFSQAAHERSDATLSRAHLPQSFLWTRWHSRIINPLVRCQFSLSAYTRVTHFCHIFSRGNGVRLICGIAYTRVYTVVND